MRGLILGCIAGLSFWATAVAQQVAFPLDYYSFEEIAQRMSVEGRRVDCARELRQRLAIVHLKPRRWQQARETLEASLDIRFRRTSETENRWILERTPESIRQERRWRELLAAYIERQRDRDSKLLRQLLDKNVPVDELVKTLLEEYSQVSGIRENFSPNELEEQVRKSVEFFRKMPVEVALRDWRSSRRLEQRFIQFLQKDTTHLDQHDPFGLHRQFVAEHPIANFGFSQEILDWVRRAATDEQDEVLKSLRETMGGLGVSVPEDAQTVQLMLLQTLGDFSWGYAQAWAREALMHQLRSPLTALEALEQGVIMREYVVHLPPEQLAWHLNDVEGTIVPLDSPAPVQTPMVGIATGGSFGFSATYEFTDARPNETIGISHTGRIDDFVTVEWKPRAIKRTLKQIDPEMLQAYEKALERHTQLVSQPPVNQPIKASLAPYTLLEETVYRWAQESEQEMVMEVFFSRIDAHHTESHSLAKRLEACPSPYLLEQRDGVWILRCWTAFLERMVDYPYAAIRDLLRSDFSYAAWRMFYRAVSAEQTRWLITRHSNLLWHPHRAPSNQLRAVFTGDLGAAWLIMLILESMPTDVRQRFWEPPADAPAPTLALTQLPLETRTRVLQTLTLWRAELIRSRRLDGRERFLPPTAWLERLQLVNDPSLGWRLLLAPIQPSDTAEASGLLTSQLPGKPFTSVPEKPEPVLNEGD